MNALGSLSHSAKQVQLLLKRFSSFKNDVSEVLLRKHLLILSEEILLSNNLYRSYIDIAGDFPVFTNCNMLLTELVEHNSAVAVFPLSDKQPSLRHLWVFEDTDNSLVNDHLPKLEDNEEIRENFPDLKVFVTPDMVFTGNSWKLAFHLARMALRNKQLRSKLAQEWIVSGNVDSEEGTKRIELGNKLDITTYRNWLLPRSNHGGWQANWEPGGRVLVAGSVEEAIDRITKGTVQKAEPMAWPEHIKDIYSLSSIAETTVVVAAILSGLKKITVFPSENHDLSVVPASSVKLFLENFTDIQVNIADNKIPFDDVYAIEQYMRKEMQLEKQTSETRLSIIHVTTGTKLMLLAASNIARNYPNVWLVYREISLNDKSSTDYTAIYYEGLQPTTRILKQESGGNENSDKLTAIDLGRLLSSKTIADYFNSNQ